MTAETSTREKVLSAIVDIFVEGGQVSMMSVTARSGVSRQRVHADGLRPLVTQFATAQRALCQSDSRLSASRISGMRAEVEMLRTAATTGIAEPSSAPTEVPTQARLRERVLELEAEVERLQDAVIAERGAVALLLRSLE